MKQGRRKDWDGGREQGGVQIPQGRIQALGKLDGLGGLNGLQGLD